MGGALGILIPEFPAQTHVLFWREIVALRGMGIEVALLSTRATPEDSCRHEFAASARAETHYVYPPKLIASLSLLARRPRRALRAVRYVIGLDESSVMQRIRSAGLLLCAADLVAYASRRGIRHIHAHSCADAAHVVAVAYMLGGPTYSLTLHGDLPVYGTDHRSKVAGAIGVTCAGQHLIAQLVDDAGVPPELVLSNWMGIDTAAFTSHARVGSRAGPLRLLTVARLNAAKGHVHALRAMRMVVDVGRDMRYTIAGEGPHRPEIEAEVDRLGLRDRVDLLGTRSEHEVLDLLREHDVFVLPSVGLGEAGPVSLMEAMSTAMPSIVSAIGSTPRMVEDGVSGILCAQGDEGALRDALITLYDDGELRVRMGQQARTRAVEEFDCRHTAARLLSFIEQHGAFTFERRAGLAVGPVG